MDGTIGQQAMQQAEAFNQATKIGTIFLTKLDGSARGRSPLGGRGNKGSNKVHWDW